MDRRINEDGRKQEKESEITDYGREENKSLIQTNED